MDRGFQLLARRIIWVLLVVCVGLLGCQNCQVQLDPVTDDLPTEKAKTNLPDYVIEPPDILIVDVLRALPKPPYKIAPLDGLLIRAENAYPTEPIAGLYVVDPDGRVTLGSSYGSVAVSGLSINGAKIAIEKQLATVVKGPKVTVSLGQSRASQQIRGQHLVRPDGTIGLGVYGSVHVTGMRLADAKTAIELHLSEFLQDPEVSVDVLAYNSKVFYVIFDGAGFGQQVIRLPSTGNDTVLDAISQVYGLVPVSDRHKIWVARPGPADAPCDQILPVDWDGVSRCARTATNYQLLPGDRIYVHSNALVCLDTFLARIYSPIERTLGVILLGSETVRSFGPSGGSSGGTGAFR
jgi:polysaccharide export outer membrane protein